MNTLKILCANVQSRIFIVLTIGSMLLFTFLDFHELYIPFYYSSMFPVMAIPFLIMNQNVNYKIQKNIYVEVRSISNAVVTKRIITVDIILAIVYVSIMTLFGNTLLFLFGFGNLSVLIQYFILMLIWSVYFTCMKDLLSVITEKNSLANVITVAFAVILRIVNQMFGIVFSNMLTTGLACLSSIVILIVIYFYLKTDEKSTVQKEKTTWK